MHFWGIRKYQFYLMNEIIESLIEKGVRVSFIEINGIGPLI